ncbi:hypothetical protein SAMN04487996_106360 [Dyadobacter soli]|uniref:DUF2158 domain-containing protein n=1 Tax=Dyadobacter soli TaxID=659014 RepID=A0A1G7FDT2_9BACT|nr:hypothetical protein [Dyadobacter soli]SDE74052.1 hypothetical protein SAMN04487996_106360 [Dyadobacter soli]
MDTFKFMKDDWVKEKGGNQLMQVDEYQIVETVVSQNGSATLPVTKRVFSGKVWCTWVNKNKAVITQPFWEDDLEPATHRQNDFHSYSTLNHTH